MTMDQDFPGKVTHCRYFFFFYLDRSVERLGGRYNYVQSCQRQRKKPAVKMEKQENELRNKITDRQTALKITKCIKACTGHDK